MASATGRERNHHGDRACRVVLLREAGRSRSGKEPRQGGEQGRASCHIELRCLDKFIFNMANAINFYPNHIAIL